MSTLDRLAGPGNVLGKEAPDAKEFDGLVRSGLARLKDAEKPENSLESRFDLAYGAAHALCLAALRHQGYRPSKRYIVFQVLPDTLGLSRASMARLIAPDFAMWPTEFMENAIPPGILWSCHHRMSPCAPKKFAPTSHFHVRRACPGFSR